MNLHISWIYLAYFLHIFWIFLLYFANLFAYCAYFGLYFAYILHFSLDHIRASKPQNTSSLLLFASLHGCSGSSLQRHCTKFECPYKYAQYANLLHNESLLFMQDVADSCNSHSTWEWDGGIKSSLHA